MRVIVLEPNGEHWLAEVPPDHVHRGIPLARRDDMASIVTAAPYAGMPISTFSVIYYEGLEFRDANGTAYWIYSRKRGY